MTFAEEQKYRRTNVAMTKKEIYVRYVKRIIKIGEWMDELLDAKYSRMSRIVKD